MKRLRNNGKSASVLCFSFIFVIFITFPLFVKNYYFLSVVMTIFLYIIFATSWDVFSGYAELVNFGHALFVGAAGYLTAYLDMTYGLSPFFILVSCGLFCGVLGLFVGFTTLRHRGPYFAILTMAFAHVAHESSVIFSDYTGGEEGISGISTLTNSWIGDYYFVLIVMTVIFILLLWFARGRYGLLLKAISQNEDVVLASGVNVTLVKVFAYVISGAACGIGGSLFAFSLMHVGSTSLEQVLSSTILIMAIIGGMGTIIGPFIGATLLVTLNELLRGIGEYRLLIYTVLVVFIVFFTPKGIVSYFKPLGIKMGIIEKGN